MIVRTWTARVAPGRSEDYARFAQTASAPMFRAMPGCLGVLFLAEADARYVVSLWSGEVALAAFERNHAYLDVAERLTRSGILAEVGPVAVGEAGPGTFLQPTQIPIG